MLLSAVSVLVVAQSNSEIPEGLMNYSVYVNCSLIDARWRYYSAHLHTNSTQNNAINNFGWKAFWG